MPGRHLNELLTQHKADIFSLIQKFNQKVEPEQPYSERDDIIVITDEAHRTQYGTLALNLRNALPNASYIGWMHETRMAVVVSEEQGEVDKFRKWDLDTTPHRRLMKEGIDLPEAMHAKPEYRSMQSMALDDAFKVQEHPPSWPARRRPTKTTKVVSALR